MTPFHFQLQPNVMQNDYYRPAYRRKLKVKAGRVRILWKLEEGLSYLSKSVNAIDKSEMWDVSKDGWCSRWRCSWLITFSLSLSLSFYLYKFLPSILLVVKKPTYSIWLVFSYLYIQGNHSLRTERQRRRFNFKGFFTEGEGKRTKREGRGRPGWLKMSFKGSHEKKK